MKLEVGTKIPLFAEGNATSEDVLEGKTFSTSNGNNLKGNISINNYLEKYPSYNDIELPKGYYKLGGNIKGIKELDDISLKSVLDNLINNDKRVQLLDNIISPQNKEIFKIIKEKIPVFNNCFAHEIIEFEVPKGTSKICKYFNNKYDNENMIVNYKISSYEQQLKENTKLLTTFLFKKYGYYLSNVASIIKENAFKGKFKVECKSAEQWLFISSDTLIRDNVNMCFEEKTFSGHSNCTGGIIIENDKLVFEKFLNDKYQLKGNYYVQIEILGLTK